MCDEAKISSPIHSAITENEILSLLIVQNCEAMGDNPKNSLHTPSPCAENTLFSLAILHITGWRHINGAMDTPFRIPSVLGLTTSSSLWIDLCGAHNVSHAELLESNGGR
jgi:hypothetical protein